MVENIDITRAEEKVARLKRELVEYERLVSATRPKISDAERGVRTLEDRQKDEKREEEGRKQRERENDQRRRDEESRRNQPRSRAA